MARTYSQQVLKKIRLFWPDQDPLEILTILNQFGGESFQMDKDRVHLAVLKLCEGKLEQLEYYLGVARSDYRDVLAWAEYPEEIRLGYSAKRQLPPEEVKALRRRDRKQYLRWLDEE